MKKRVVILCFVFLYFGLFFSVFSMGIVSGANPSINLYLEDIGSQPRDAYVIVTGDICYRTNGTMVPGTIELYAVNDTKVKVYFQSYNSGALCSTRDIPFAFSPVVDGFSKRWSNGDKKIIAYQTGEVGLLEGQKLQLNFWSACFSPSVLHDDVSWRAEWSNNGVPECGDSYFKLYSQEAEKSRYCKQANFLKSGEKLSVNVNGYMKKSDSVKAIAVGLGLTSYGDGYFEDYSQDSDKDKVLISIDYIDGKTIAKIRTSNGIWETNKRYYKGIFQTQEHRMVSFYAYQTDDSYTNYLYIVGGIDKSDFSKGDKLRLTINGDPCPDPTAVSPICVKGSDGYPGVGTGIVEGRIFEKASSSYMDYLYKKGLLLHGYPGSQPDSTLSTVKRIYDSMKCYKVQKVKKEDCALDYASEVLINEKRYNITDFKQCTLKDILYENCHNGPYGSTNPEYITMKYLASERPPLIASFYGGDVNELDDSCIPPLAPTLLTCYKKTAKVLSPGIQPVEKAQKDLVPKCTFQCTTACMCPKEQTILGEFKVSVDAIDTGSMSSTTPDFLSFLKNTNDVTFGVTIKGDSVAKINAFPATLEEQYLCGIPKSVDITISTGAWYYDALVKTDALINQSETAKKEIVDVLAEVIKTSKGSNYNYNDYFIPENFRNFNMILRTPKINPFAKSYSVFLTEEITIRMKLDGDQLKMYVQDSVDSPVKENKEAYESEYKKYHEPGKEFVKSMTKGGLDEKNAIVIASGPGAYLVYSGMVNTLMVLVPEAIDKVDAFKTESVKPVRSSNGRNVMRFIHVIPTIEKDTLSQLLDAHDTIVSCCKTSPTPSTVKGPIYCPEDVYKFTNYVKVGNDAETKYDWTKDPLFYDNPDATIKFLNTLENLRYDSSSNVVDTFFKCGTPEKATMSIDINGVYYDTIYKNVNVFATSREKVLEKFPPAIIKEVFGNKKIFIDQKEMADKIEAGDVWYYSNDFLGQNDLHDAADDSQDISEKIELTFIKEPGKLKLKLTDSIFTRPHARNSGSTRYHLYPSTKFTPISTEAVFLDGEPGATILYSKLVEGLVNNMKTLKDTPKFNEPYYDELARQNGVSLLITPYPEYSLDSVDYYNNLKAECCKSKQSTNSDGSIYSTELIGVSVYLLRDSNNYDYRGIAYAVQGSNNITVNLTKSFKTNYSKEDVDIDYSIYRLDDGMLSYCNYTVLGQKQYASNMGTFASDDGFFEVEAKEYAYADINITTIDIHDCGIFDSISEKFNVANAPVVSLNISEILSSLKDYTQNNTDESEMNFKLNLWAI